MRVDGQVFKDEAGRTFMLRGVNLGGSSKVPFRPDGATHIREGFFDHRECSFVGRPFPLEEADEHLRRLQAWGFNFLRLLVTWEAIEHEGPGCYDEAYLDYIQQVAEKAGEYGFYLLIDPHQDVWSRFTGGDGAPGWTLGAVGFDPTRFAATGAAIVHATHGDPLPPMIWPTNGTKLAAATMFTLFFAGNDLAPKTEVGDEPVQEFLQRHYIAAIQQVASRLRGLKHVLGYDTMNEPLRGYIGCGDLTAPLGPLTLGPCPTPLQAMALGSGIPETVDIWRLGRFGLRRAGATLLNQGRHRAWREGVECIWREHGVWGVDAGGAPRILRPHHFRQVAGRELDFGQDYYRPFANRFAKAIQAAHPGTIIFLETEPGGLPPRWGAGDAENVAFAPHWYDVSVLVARRYSSFLAVDIRTGKLVAGLPARIRRSFVEQLASFRQGAKQRLGEVPVVLGEFGVPFDLPDKSVYRTGDLRVPERALDRCFQAVEANLLDSALWNYTADNTNERGDQWNGEDLSIFSRDQQTDPADLNSGGRALGAVVRPYPRAIAGKPRRLHFNLRHRCFEFTFIHDPEVTAPTEVFVPNLQYPRGYRVEVSDGTWEADKDTQLLRYWPAAGRREHTLRISP